MITLQDRELWVCQNPACKAEIIVVTFSELVDATVPRCFCGSVMGKDAKELQPADQHLARKARYSKPAVTVYGTVGELTKQWVRID
jgi:hypothetical protein